MHDEIKWNKSSKKSFWAEAQASKKGWSERWKERISWFFRDEEEQDIKSEDRLSSDPKKKEEHELKKSSDLQNKWWHALALPGLFILWYSLWFFAIKFLRIDDEKVLSSRWTRYSFIRYPLLVLILTIALANIFYTLFSK